MAARRLISSGSPFEAQAGYSRALVDGRWCFVSGSTGYDPATRIMPDDVVEQARNAIGVITAALEEAGLGLRDVVRVRYYLTDGGDFDRLAPLFGAAFAEARPAATAIVCGLIRPEMKIEIEVTALAPARDA